MDVYIRDCDVYCENCANDGDDGPYANGGGEADCFQHCAGCGCFLDNPLTSEGVRYTLERILSHDDGSMRGNADVIDVWKDAMEERGFWPLFVEE